MGRITPKGSIIKENKTRAQSGKTENRKTKWNRKTVLKKKKDTSLARWIQSEGKPGADRCAYALTAGQCSVPSTPVGQLTAIYNSSSRGPGPSSGLSGHSCTHGICPYWHNHRYVTKSKHKSKTKQNKTQRRHRNSTRNKTKAITTEWSSH